MISELRGFHKMEPRRRYPWLLSRPFTNQALGNHLALLKREPGPGCSLTVGESPGMVDYLLPMPRLLLGAD